MGDEKRPPERETNESGEGREDPPPFKPDPRLVTYLEPPRKNDAPEKFRKAMEERKRRSQ